MNDIKRSIQKNGWVKVKNVFTEDETDEIICQVNHLAIKQTLDEEEPVLIDISKEGRLTPRKLAEPFFLNHQFRQFVFSQRIAQLISPIIGSGADLLFDHVFMKPALCGAQKHWHQDGFYFDIKPPDKGITVWIALCDAYEGNGCLRYISGSHKLGLLPHSQPDNNPALAQVTNDYLEDKKSVVVPAQRGDVIMHHFHTVHSSGPNLSTNSRIAYATHWLGKGCTGAGVSWFKSYPLRAEYKRLIENESLRI